MDKKKTTTEESNFRTLAIDTITKLTKENAKLKDTHMSSDRRQQHATVSGTRINGLQGLNPRLGQQMQEREEE